MLLLLILLAAPTLRDQCLVHESSVACDRWIAALSALGTGPTRSDLRRACAFEAPQACGRLAAHARDPQIRVRALSVACQTDDRACDLLIDAQSDHRVPKPAQARAQQILRRACRRRPSTCYRLGTHALRAQRPTDARRLLTRGCLGSDARACGELAWRLERGDGLPRDRAGARRFGDRACRAGDDRLCLHRLRQRQAAGDRAGIARACRQGDTLSCAARDARRCRDGDVQACTRAAVAAPGTCAATARTCPQDERPHIGACRPTDRCAQARAAQTRALHQAFRALPPECAPPRARITASFARSGDAYRVDVRPASPCLQRAVERIQVPPSESPSLASVQLRVVQGRPRVSLHVRSRVGPPIQASPPPPLGILRPGFKP